MSEWQPIETAPKDGSRLLLATPTGKLADGMWSTQYKVWSWPYVITEPTHWMPAPPIPQKAPNAKQTSEIERGERMNEEQMRAEFEDFRIRFGKAEGIKPNEDDAILLRKISWLLEASQAKSVPPIERDEEMQRDYIPLPANWEIQTKGKGSTFRLAKTDGSDIRWPILEEMLHAPLEQMAREIHAAWQAAKASQTKSVPDRCYVITDGIDGLMAVSQAVAGQLICIRDLLVTKDYEEAYHALYSLADPDFTSLTPWQKLEDIAKGIGCLQASDEAADELREVYEAARQFLRYYGVDKDRASKAMERLEFAIETVKNIDGGYKDFPLEQPTDERVRELEKDAARYHWLKDNYHGFAHYRSGVIPCVDLDQDIDRQLAKMKEAKQ